MDTIHRGCFGNCRPPISREMTEIYNYSVKPNGFYLIDRHVEPAVAGHAMKLFVDEALSHTDAVTVRKL